MSNDLGVKNKYYYRCDGCIEWPCFVCATEKDAHTCCDAEVLDHENEICNWQEITREEFLEEV